MESTHRPCDLLWVQATAKEWLADHNPEPDYVESIDRLFLIQYHGDRLTLPRSPAVAAALGPAERDGIWYLIRADVPSHAFNHQHRLLADEPGHSKKGDCRVCPAEILGDGSLSDLLRLAACLGTT